MHARRCNKFVTLGDVHSRRRSRSFSLYKSPKTQQDCRGRDREGGRGADGHRGGVHNVAPPGRQRRHVLPARPPRRRPPAVVVQPRVAAAVAVPLAVALGDLAEAHAVLERLLPALAVVARLAQVDVALGRDEADEALVADHVAPLGVRVHQAVLGPRAEAAVLALWRGKSLMLEDYKLI